MDPNEGASNMGNDKLSLQTIKVDLQEHMPQLQEALPATAKRYLTAERMIKIATMAVSKSPLLLDCTRVSLLSSIMEAASFGLDFGQLGQAYLVPRWNKKVNGYEASLIIGYRGLIALSRRSGDLRSITAQVVYEKDEFELDLGSGKPPIHRPFLHGERGMPIAVYAVAWLVDGGTACDYMTWADVMKIKNRSQARTKSGDITGPWATDEDEMARKTVVRRLAKYLPMSVELADAIEIDDRQYGFAGEVARRVVEIEQKERPQIGAGMPPIEEASKPYSQTDSVLEQLSGKGKTDGSPS
jgi:recombination protein RecT